ncbi:lipocalin-like domain-containing protein [Amphritea balenae]|uniref:Carotenoid 1,2-hydratase n=1 Tax=Amphritea balenae TaxID=452629 RepID=A0A3P1SMJ6_9GAMM|nr:lipocalin-like domain-containing protein [Amphritea balenae]RRC98179.1 carotenoid 1,2-hydratase [Amphritea balenae]GGK79831.1 iron ABC transporter permease [Amphritea balenae]
MQLCQHISSTLLCTILFTCLSVNAKPLPTNSSENAEFSIVEPGHPITFPFDHRLHPGFQSEWWYITANLQDEDNNQYGIQFTLFSSASLTGNTKQRIFFAHAALTTTDNFYHAERYARSDMGHAGVEYQPWQAYLDHWQFTGTEQQPLPGKLQVSEPAFAYQLKLSDSDYFLQGDQGFSPKNNDASLASYYYSAPFIEVSGNIHVEGKSIAVRGKAWLDREWSSNFIEIDKIGWDWLSLHLDQDTALMLYRVRSNREILLYGRIMHRDGRQTTIAPTDINWRAVASQRFSGKDYPIEWRLEIPSQQITLDIQPINNNQFLNTRVPYWEGAVITKGSHEAQGYLELFGER